MAGVLQPPPLSKLQMHTEQTQQQPRSGLIALTLGDPCGIGPEIVLRAFAQAPEVTAGLVVVGDRGVLERQCALLHRQHGPMPIALQTVADPAQALRCEPGVVPVVQPGADLPELAWGQVDARAGRAAGDWVCTAAGWALSGQVDALVTAPLHKEALHAAGDPYSRYPGHTELLQALSAAHRNLPLAQMPVRMMLASPDLRVVLVSIHVSLRQALEAITLTQVSETLRITHQALGAVLGREPRMALAGVNPHAGEGGLMGREEIDVLMPAIAQAQEAGIDASGPYAPDTVFMRARRGEFDVVLAMYHDQGLIPIKYLGVEQGVNVTLGLPLIRTSPDHGTAFDIAGLGRADASSLLAAIKMARQLCS